MLKTPKRLAAATAAAMLAAFVPATAASAVDSYLQPFDPTVACTPEGKVQDTQLAQVLTGTAGDTVESVGIYVDTAGSGMFGPGLTVWATDGNTPVDSDTVTNTAPEPFTFTSPGWYDVTLAEPYTIPTGGTFTVHADVLDDITYCQASTTAPHGVGWFKESAGSWAQDPFVNAYALRAGVTAATTPDTTPPTAVDDDVTFAPNTGQLDLNIVGNDSDDDSGLDLASVALTPGDLPGVVYNAEFGRVNIDTDGADPGVYVGSYTIDDNAGNTSNSATITVTIEEPNSAPFAPDSNRITDEDTVRQFEILGFATDPDNDPLTLDSVTQPSNGTAEIVGSELRYTPDANFNGTDEFTYTISDDRGGEATGTVNMVVYPVNDPIVAVDDTATTAYETSTAIDVLANDINVDDDALSVNGVTSPANGTAAFDGATVTYTPDDGFQGADTFTYTAISEGGDEDTATVNVTVTAPPNQAPLAADDTVTTPFGAPVTVDVLANDSDPDSDPLTIDSVADPANGSAEVVDDEVLYTPDRLHEGVDTFTYTISDGNGGTDTATVQVTTEDAARPEAVNDTSELTFYGTPVVVDVLANDSSAPGVELTINSVTQPATGTLLINEAEQTLTYNPPAGPGSSFFTTPAQYTIIDELGHTTSATVFLRVRPQDTTPPTVADDEASFEADSGEHTFSLTGNDSDDLYGLDLGSVQLDDEGLPAGATYDSTTGELTISTDGVNPSVYAGTYTIDDRAGNTSEPANITVTITAPPDPPTPNTPPVAADDEMTVDWFSSTRTTLRVTDNDTDADGDTLTVTRIVTQPTYGAVRVTDGRVEFANTVCPLFQTNCPPSNSTPDEFVYEISDGNGGTDTATVFINPSEPDTTAPVVRDDDAGDNIRARSGEVVIDLLANDTDNGGSGINPDSIELDLPADSGNTGAWRLDGSNLIFDTDEFSTGGSFSVTYTVADNADNRSRSATVTADIASPQRVTASVTLNIIVIKDLFSSSNIEDAFRSAVLQVIQKDSPDRVISPTVVEAASAGPVDANFDGTAVLSSAAAAEPVGTFTILDDGTLQLDAVASEQLIADATADGKQRSTAVFELAYTVDGREYSRNAVVDLAGVLPTTGPGSDVQAVSGPQRSEVTITVDDPDVVDVRIIDFTSGLEVEVEGRQITARSDTPGLYVLRYEACDAEGLCFVEPVEVTISAPGSGQDDGADSDEELADTGAPAGGLVLFALLAMLVGAPLTRRRS